MRYDKLTVREIAMHITRDWKNPYFGAKPYISAMRDMDQIADNYYLDSGESIVRYFLSNADSWKGSTAGEIKRELNNRLKQARVKLT